MIVEIKQLISCFISTIMVRDAVPPGPGAGPPVRDAVPSGQPRAKRARRWHLCRGQGRLSYSTNSAVRRSDNAWIRS